MPSQSRACGTSENAFALSPRLDATIAPNPSISGAFAAVDAKNGKTLWHLGTGGIFKASPITYMVGGRQYVAIASGANIIAFALPESKGK